MKSAKSRESNENKEINGGAFSQIMSGLNVMPCTDELKSISSVLFSIIAVKMSSLFFNVSIEKS